MVRLRSVSLLVALAGTPLFTHCGSSSDKAPSGQASAEPGSYRGLLTGSSETGVLDITIGDGSAQALVLAGTTPAGNVSGSISWVSGGGTKVTLTGSFDASTGKLTLSGTNGSGKYTLTGSASGGSFQGNYSGPNGSGSFSLASAAGTGSVTLYCGTYAGDASGAWNFLIDGSGNITGSHCDDTSCGLLTGKASGNDITLTPDKQSHATGTKSGAKASGTWTGPKGSTGTWQGSSEACVVPTDAGSDAGESDAGSDAGAQSTQDSGPTEIDAGTDAGAAQPVVDTIVTGLSDPFDLAADDDFVYFFTSGEIHRCPVGGCASGTGDLVVGALAVPSGVATSGSAIFWTHDFNQIGTCTVSKASATCAPSTFTVMDSSNKYPAQLLVANDRLYWTSQDGDGPVRRVQVCPLTGCSAGYPKTILDSSNASLLNGVPTSSLVITDSNLFIQSFVGPVFRFAMSDPETVDAASGMQVANGPYGGGGAALDGTTLFWGASNDGKVQQCSVPDCASVTDYVTGLVSPGAIGVTSAGIFIAERGMANGQGGYVAGTGAVRVIRK